MINRALKSVFKRFVHDKNKLESFKIFCDSNAKFRVGVTAECNFDCFFCHNEGMPNPRKNDLTPCDVLNDDDLQQIINDFYELGGTSINITGGEPLLRDDIFEFLDGINKPDDGILMLNTNLSLGEVLLSRPPHPNITYIYSSFHKTTEEHYANLFKAPQGSADRIMNNLVDLKKHGYEIHVNMSLGEYNFPEFEKNWNFLVENDIIMKIISIIRSESEGNQYGSNDESYCTPKLVKEKLLDIGAELLDEYYEIGGFKSIFKSLPDPNNNHLTIVKDIREGRLRTDLCKGCTLDDFCGEGIYALRIGPDAIFKPCVLNKDTFISIESGKSDYKEDILNVIHDMIGNWNDAYFVNGNPL